MTRLLIENIFFFLLPTVAYVAYEAYKRNSWPGLSKILRGAPLIKLFISGTALMLSTLLLFSSYTGHSPKEGYSPPSYHDGKVTPGQGTGSAK